MTMRRREFIKGTVGSAVAGWPLAARAQPAALPVIGFLSPGSPKSDTGRMSAVRQGLRETGYIEDQNYAIEYRGAQDKLDLLPALAADLVSRGVTLIVTVATPATLAAKAATTTIPIIFNVGVDPVQFSLGTSLNRPGGNITGINTLNVAVIGKRVELLHELLPTAGVIAFLANPNSAFTQVETKALSESARRLGVELRVLNVGSASEIDTAFMTLAKEQSVPVVVSADALFMDHRVQFIVLAARYTVPAIYWNREFAAAGGLMSYGPDLADTYRQAGIYAGKILKGSKPADLPIQQAVKVELVINLNTAKALGITFPVTLLGRADEVIE
jgi:putative tryptophan/tyrosine transport system substrate-binding protein